MPVPLSLDTLPRMKTRAKWWSAAGLLAAVAIVGAPGCKKEKKAEPAPTEPAPAGETPPTTPPAATDPATAGQPGSGTEAPAAGSEQQAASAVAELKPASGSEVSGTVTFTEKDGKVEVAVDLKGLKPGDHGFHIHEKGDCSAPDAKSAGDHFNPDKKDHGAPGAPAHHAGDLGNLTVGEDGTVKTTTTVDFLSLADGANSAVGKAVIVHEKADDLKSQPAGNAGARLACGVVEKK